MAHIDKVIGSDRREGSTAFDVTTGARYSLTFPEKRSIVVSD
jgi:hypothetical protein